MSCWLPNPDHTPTDPTWILEPSLLDLYPRPVLVPFKQCSPFIGSYVVVVYW